MGYKPIYDLHFTQMGLIACANVASEGIKKNKSIDACED